MDSSGLPLKVLTVSAGIRSSYIITEEFNLLWCGTNG